MGKIVLLDDLTINKIAAGEVIERPASCVKEMCENSIDAGAKNITVEIKNGGISLIKIVDDGCGISEDDMEISFERHATSKIRSAEDLSQVKTMGFRGEALASIAAISNVEMISKRPEDEVGHRIVVEGGRVIEKGECGAPNGTSITVKNLFFNTPVRYKFLKKDFTESGYIEDAINRLALINKNVSIKLVNTGKTVIQTNGNNDIKTVVYSIYGKDTADGVKEVEYTYEDIKVTGVIGNSSIARSNRNGQLFFVNNRYVKDKTLSSAVEQAYKDILPDGKYGFVILNLEIDPAKVDCNVHPAKLEIRFEEEQKVFKAIYHAIKSQNDELVKTIRKIPEIKNQEIINDDKKIEQNEDNIKENIANEIEEEKIEKRKEEFKPRSNAFSGFFKKFRNSNDEEENTLIKDIFEAKKSGDLNWGGFNKIDNDKKEDEKEKGYFLENKNIQVVESNSTEELKIKDKFKLEPESINEFEITQDKKIENNNEVKLDKNSSFYENNEEEKLYDTVSSIEKNKEIDLNDNINFNETNEEVNFANNKISNEINKEVNFASNIISIENNKGINFNNNISSIENNKEVKLGNTIISSDTKESDYTVNDILKEMVKKDETMKFDSNELFLSNNSKTEVIDSIKKIEMENSRETVVINTEAVRNEIEDSKDVESKTENSKINESLDKTENISKINESADKTENISKINESIDKTENVDITITEKLLEQKVKKDMEDTQFIDTGKVREELLKKDSKEDETPMTSDFADMYKRVFGMDVSTVRKTKEEENAKLDFSNNIQIADTIENETVFEVKEEMPKIQYRYIGTIFDSFSIIEVKDEMYMIEKSAAEERLMYEIVKSNFYSDKDNSVTLLLADIVTLNQKEMGMARDLKEMYEKAGFEYEEFGDCTLKLVKVPSWAESLNTKKLFLEILSEMNTVAITDIQDKEEKFISTISSKYVMLADTNLDNKELEDLIRRLLLLDSPFIYPNGKLTAVKITKANMEKKFSRR